MICSRRLLTTASVLGLAGIFACAQLWGDPKRSDKDRDLESWRGSDNRMQHALPKDLHFSDDVAKSRFADQPVVTYQNLAGETLFALQIKPALSPVTPRPRDILVLIDTSASKAKGPLALAERIAEDLISRLGPEDRLALWTVNTKPRDLSRGFKHVRELDPAVKELAKEYPSGAVNLKDGLSQAINSFETLPGRQRSILFLGDGKSVAGPLDNEDRAALAAQMVQRQISYFAIPIGDRIDSLNIHGFVNATGGKVVRLASLALEAPADNASKKSAGFVPTAQPGSIDVLVVARFLEALAAPVLYPDKLELPPEVVEAFPAKLPPLRPDVGTLVVGKIKPGKVLSYRVRGMVAEQEISIEAAPAVPSSDEDNFFLVSIFNQWRAAKDRPALMQADRALTFAFEQNQMARADLLAKAEMALDEDKFDAAINLFKQAQVVDPHNPEAKSGAVIAQKLRTLQQADKKLNHEQLRDTIKKELQLDAQPGDVVARLDGHGQLVRLPAEPVAQAVPKIGELAPAEQPGDLLKEQQARQAVANQQARQVVDDAIRSANREVRLDPDGAVELLRRTLDSVRNNPDLSENTRLDLGGRLERSLQSVTRDGARIKSDQAQAQANQARIDALNASQALITVTESRVRERLRVFSSLMNEAREKEAYVQAQNIRQDLINQGLPVPPAVTGAYQIGLSGYNLREIQELIRIRKERFLAVMLQVEKSQVPFPDEPPVEFPAPAVWKEMMELRKAKYQSTGLGAGMPKRGLELLDRLGETVKFAGFDDPRTTLAEALEALAARYGLVFDVNEKAFKFEQVPDVLKTAIADPNPIPKMETSLGTVLKRILNRIPAQSGATYIIRRDVIEITTGQFATAEKTIRVYPVADLITPIPNSFNTQAVTSQATLFGNAGALGGLPGLQLGGLGAVGAAGGLALGAVAGLGGGLGAIGALGALGAGGLGALGAGGLGALGAGGLGALGAAGLGALGAGGLGAAGIGGGGFGLAGGVQLGVQLGGFQGNFQGAANLGVGGGAAGFGGGQLGQFGNLGGQFGLQGGDQSQLLITVIRQTVGTPKDWLPQFNPITGEALRPLDDAGEVGVLTGENNQLGYFSPARALVVKGSSRLHTRSQSPNVLSPPGGGPGGMGAANREGHILVGGPKPDPKTQVASAAAANADDASRPAAGATARQALKRKLPLVETDPRVIWQDALAKGVNDPGLIIAVADYLGQNGKFDHVAEFLKADLRLGIVVDTWVYQSLALALRESGGSPDEIERAEVAAVDLEPQDAQGFLRAARAMANLKRYDRAMAFCKQAALLEPNLSQPYSQALAFAELASDAPGMEWAAGNLLKQDWPINNQQLQSKAQRKLEALAGLLERHDRKSDAQRLLDVVLGKRQRDLAIKLSWQGEGHLALKVIEPSGSVCSALTRQTVGGGTLIGDVIGGGNTETYMAAEAFPGEYEIQVERVWGRSLNDRAQLQIIRNQGTPEETAQVVAVDVKAGKPFRFQFDQGRRTHAAFVPPPEAVKAARTPVAAATSPDQVLNQLRALADPEVTGYERGFRGEVASSGAAVVGDSKPVAAAGPRPGDQVMYQTKVRSFVQNSMDVTAQAVLSADRRSVRVSLNPVFSTATASEPVITNPLIPGATNP